MTAASTPVRRTPKIRRRDLLIGGAASAIAAACVLRPSDRGAPYDDYFGRLNAELRKNGPMRPCIVVDLDRVDHNLELVTQTLRRGGKDYRIVEKSLPCQSLIRYVAERSGSRRLMSFHQPFLNVDAEAFPDFDILVGKPLPVRSAALFYDKIRGRFDPSRQLQWLVDTPARLQQYLELAQGRNTRLRINIEIDVGLHRGGVDNNNTLQNMLESIAANPQWLTFAGFMGYDGHVGFVPHALASSEELCARGVAIYQQFVDYARREFPLLWNSQLTLNTGGSPSYRLHEFEKLSTEVSVGTALLKPTHYDIDTLSGHIPAAFIATPVLKATGPLMVPGLDEKSKIFSWWDVNQRETYYIYGGYWLADYESPKGLRFNSALGHSANQENVTASPSVHLQVDDQVFLRPTIVESVLLQFGDLVTVRNGKIGDYWPVYQQAG
jgi:D-serine deaminase-like pyridoxal phosphate-dependent protein